MGNYKRFEGTVIDCDGHILEPQSLWDDYIESRYRDAANSTLYVHDYPAGGSAMVCTGKYWGGPSNAPGSAGKRPFELDRHWRDGEPGAFDPHERIKILDSEEIDKAILYPTLCAMLGGVDDRGLAAAMARAYNNWLAEFCSAYPDRLFGAAIVPLQDVTLAIAELRRTVEELRMKAVVVRPNLYGGQPLHAPQFDPFWMTVQELDIPVGLHPFPTNDMEGTIRSIEGGYSIGERIIGKFQPVGSVGMADLATFPLDNMLTFARLVLGGVLDRFPKLRIALLESHGSWITMWLERMDTRYRLTGSSRAMRAELPKRKPSEYFHERCAITFEGGEAALPLLADVVGEDNILWASDYPHYDCTYPGAVEEVEENILHLEDAVRRKIVGENAGRFFDVPVNV